MPSRCHAQLFVFVTGGYSYGDVAVAKAGAASHGRDQRTLPLSRDSRRACNAKLVAEGQRALVIDFAGSFLRGIGIVAHWQEYGWPEICRQLDGDDFECD